MLKRNKTSQRRIGLELRLDIYSGAVIAGMISKNKFTYDIWGNAVNLASRIESSGEAGKINISDTTYELVKDKNVPITEKIQAKTKAIGYVFCRENALICNLENKKLCQKFS